MKSATARTWNHDPMRLDLHRPIVPTGEAIAWWVNSPREAFTDRARQQFVDHMQHSRDHLRMQLRVLQ